VASSDDLLNNDEIESLLARAQGGPAEPGSPPAAAPGGNLLDPGELKSLVQNNRPGAGGADSAQTVSSRADQLLNEVDAGLDAALAESPRGRSHVVSNADDAHPFNFADLTGEGTGRSKDRQGLGALDDVELDLHIELGRAELLIDEVLSLREGSVVPLDKLAGDPVDILVNGRLLARGEVLVLNDSFCVRVAEIVTPDY